MTYRLVRPGITLIGIEALKVPIYPFRYEIPKIGDKVWVIVENEDSIAIDCDIIEYISDYYEYAVQTYNYRKNIIAGETEWPEYEGVKIEINLGEPPKLGNKENYLIDFWLKKYKNGHANCFGETIYSSFEEARSVFIQFFSDYKEWHRILKMSELELKPEED